MTADTMAVLEKLVTYRHYRLKDGREFEFRYVCRPTYGFLFGLIGSPHSDAYINVEDLDEPLAEVEPTWLTYEARQDRERSATVKTCKE